MSLVQSLDNTHMPDLIHIPYQLTEAMFRKFETAIQVAVSEWPKEQVYTKADMWSILATKSPNTFAARYRDALLSLRRFKWATGIDMTKLMNMSGEYAISHDSDGNVYFRTKLARGRPSSGVTEARTEGVQIDASVNRTPWTSTTQEEIHALCTLLHTERLVGPFVIVGSMDSDMMEGLEGQFNVSFHFDTKNQQTIIQ